jgi:DNA-binding transcriptional MerR regulator
MFSISDLANEFSITRRTLRFYEEKGILHPQRENQKRVYSVGDRTTLKLVLRGKRLGFTLNESLDIIELYDPISGNRDQFMTLQEKIREKQHLLAQQKQDIALMIDDLNEASIRCSESIATIAKDSLE